MNISVDWTLRRGPSYSWYTGERKIERSRLVSIYHRGLCCFPLLIFPIVKRFPLDLCTPETMPFLLFPYIRFGLCGCRSGMVCSYPGFGKGTSVFKAWDFQARFRSSTFIGRGIFFFSELEPQYERRGYCVAKNLQIFICCCRFVVARNILWSAVVEGLVVRA
jgi:hypothetical protein